MTPRDAIWAETIEERHYRNLHPRTGVQLPLKRRTPDPGRWKSLFGWSPGKKRARQCCVKVRFKDIEVAKRVRWYFPKQHYYWCRWCRGYHMTKSSCEAQFRVELQSGVLEGCCHA